VHSTAAAAAPVVRTGTAAAAAPVVRTSTAAAAAPVDGLMARPAVTSDPATARECLRRTGAVLFQCVPPDAAASLTEAEVVAHIAAAPARVFGEQIVTSLPPVCKKLGVGSGRDRPGDLGLERNQPHMDTAYGSRSNDFLVLMHSKFADSGGENYLLDGIEMLRSLPQQVRRAAAEVELEGVAQREGAQNQYGGEPIHWRGPCYQTLESGREWLLTPTGGGIRNVDGTGGLAAYLAEPSSACSLEERRAGEDLISCLHAAIVLAEPHAERFMIEAGQALIVDNYRLFHGRELFTGTRDLWRVWFWTNEASADAVALAESLQAQQQQQQQQ